MLQTQICILKYNIFFPAETPTVQNDSDSLFIFIYLFYIFVEYKDYILSFHNLFSSQNHNML